MVALRKIVGKPKYYFAFPIVVVAMVGANFIPIPCPVCNGTGLLDHSIDMEYVKIVTTDSRILSRTQDACTSYIVVKAAPVFRISNASQNQASGYLVLRLMDTIANQEISVQYLYIDAPANALSTIETSVVFAYVSANPPTEGMDILAEVLLDDHAPCSACSGKCKVSFNVFPLTRAYKEEFISIVRESSEYGPKGDLIYIGGGQWVEEGSKEWADWMELN